jgi:hypothetical protein
VEVRKYSHDYLVATKRKIELVSHAVASAVRADGRQGACVDASGMVGRMLDSLHVWNYVVKATLTVQFGPKTGLRDRFFWDLDEGEFAAAHAYVVAPPFGVVDVTIGEQDWDEKRKKVIPKQVLSESWDAANAELADIANDKIQMFALSRGIGLRDFLATNYPHYLDVMDVLPARLVKFSEVSLKYVPIGVGGTIEQLEGITAYKPGGRTALEIFDDEVKPQLKH